MECQVEMASIALQTNRVESELSSKNQSAYFAMEFFLFKT